LDIELIKLIRFEGHAIILRNPVYARCNRHIDAMHARMRRALDSMRFSIDSILTLSISMYPSRIISLTRAQKKKKRNEAKETLSL